MTTETTTAQSLAEAIAAADINGKVRHRVMTALQPDDVCVIVTEYWDGWVPNSYRYPKPGKCMTTRITATGVTQEPGTYDRKRSGGEGPCEVVTIAKAGQKRGRHA